jgi:YD repeat-containing protein
MRKILCLLLTAMVFLTACKAVPPAETPETTGTAPTTVTTAPTVPETTAPTAPTEPPVMHTVYFWTEQKVTNTQGVGGVYTRTYDEKGNLLTDSYAAADGNTTYSNTYTYDETGKMLTRDSVDSHSTTDHTEYTYDPAGRLVTEMFTNSENYSAKVDYIYREDGNIVEKIAVYDKTQEITAYTYDENGRLLKEEHTVRAGEKVQQSAVMEYTYDGAGNKLTQTETRMGELSRKEEWTYNEAGKVLTYKEFDGQGNPGEGMKYIYDNQGRLEEETFYKGETAEDAAVYVYDEAGRVIKRASGIPYEKFITVNKIILYTYDEFGNLLTEVTTKKDGTELSRREYTYIAMELPVK